MSAWAPNVWSQGAPTWRIAAVVAGELVTWIGREVASRGRPQTVLGALHRMAGLLHRAARGRGLPRDRERAYPTIAAQRRQLVAD